MQIENVGTNTNSYETNKYTDLNKSLSICMLLHVTTIMVSILLGI